MMTGTINSLDDLMVGVINNGPIEPTWFYDIKNHPEGYTYKSRTDLKGRPIPENKDAITVVPWKVAEHHWALSVKQDEQGKIRIVRKDWRDPNDRDSALTARLACVCPKKFHKPNPDEPGHYIDDPQVKEWFLKGVTFKAKARKMVYTEEEFNAA